VAKAQSSPILANRTGARTRDLVPDAVVQGLNDGSLESVNLVEWLVVDHAQLLDAILPELGLKVCADPLRNVAAALAAEGVIKRLSGVGKAFYAVLRNHPHRDAVLDAMAIHPSDTVRQWAAYARLEDRGLDLKQRLEACRQVATDANMSVRELAWMVWRPFLIDDLANGLDLLIAWSRDPDANIRRFASEVSRPRGVWCAHIKALKADPAPGLGVIAPLKSDPSRYVQASVANWLNDASKSQPDWVTKLCTDWLSASPTPDTGWIVGHATRTLKKRGVLADHLATAIVTAKAGGRRSDSQPTARSGVAG